MVHSRAITAERAGRTQEGLGEVCVVQCDAGREQREDTVRAGVSYEHIQVL